MSELTLNPPPPRSRLLYPQAEERLEGRLDRIVYGCWGLAVRGGERFRQNRFARIIDLTASAAGELDALDNSELAAHRHDLRAALRHSATLTGRYRDDLVAQAFALVRMATESGLGRKLTEDQLIGGMAVLAGNVVEMEAGEGKTLAATLAACTSALAGMPTHVVCASDDFARRDGENMAPLYEALGLSVGIISHDDDNAARRAAHMCSVTYAASAELAFEHLRDRMVLGAKSSDIHLKLDRLYGEAGRSTKLLMRGLGFAVVDDADAVLLDQACSPQSISGTGNSNNEEQAGHRALAVADGLEIDTHFRIFEDESRVEISEHGIDQIRNIIDQDDDLRTGPAIRGNL